MRLSLLTVVALVSCGTQTEVAAPTPEEPLPNAVLVAGDHAISLTSGGRQRDYLVHVPTTASGAPPRMVLVAFHGGGGTPANMQGKSGLDEIADREGFVTIYPEALGGGGTPTWNAGLGCCGYARDADLDDVGFFVDILEDMAKRHPINRNRIWVTGHSNGAMLAHRIAAEVPERIAGAIGVAGALQVPHVVPRSAVPILHIHSEDDPRAFYLGGDRGANTHANVESMLASWATTNSCGPIVVEVELRTDSQSGHQARHLRWNCQGAPLEHWRLTGPGHAWPGNPVPAWKVPVLGPGTEVIQAAEEVWAFIVRQGG